MSFAHVEDVSVQDIVKRMKPRKHYVYYMRIYWRDGLITTAYRSYSSILHLQEKLVKIEDFLSQQREATGMPRNGALLRGNPYLDIFTIKKKAKALKRMPGIEEFLQCVVHLPPHISESDAVINFFHPLPEDLIQLDDQQHQSYEHLDHRRGSKFKYVHHISEPFLLEQYVAISDYTKSQVNDISLKVGHVVDVIEKHEHGWWFVDLDGEVGWVPASYLEPRDGTEDEQIVEKFEEGQEETCITMAEFKPDLDDELGFEMGKIAKVVQKNLDGWCLIRFGNREGWAPSMYLREVATTSNQGKQREKQAVRNMLRDQRSVMAITGRRQTWDPPKRTRSVERKVPRARVRQTESTSTEIELTKSARSYVNLEFLERTQKAGGRHQVRQKLNPEEVRAKVMSGNQPDNDSKQNKDLLLAGDSFRPRPLSLVEEEGDTEMVSCGTSPIPSPLLCERFSNTASFEPVPSHDSSDGEGTVQTKPEEQKPSSTPTVSLNKAEEVVNNGSKETEVQDDGGDFKENKPTWIDKRKYYAMGSYKKDGELEVNLKENAEVEVIEESEGGWWLVRTSSHSVGWAPSNYLERIRSLTYCRENNSKTDENTNHFTFSEADQNDVNFRPERPPKSPRAQKMAKNVCIEKRFWSFIQKGKEMETCSIRDETSPSTGTNRLNEQSAVEKGEVKPLRFEVSATVYDDLECDPNSGVCKRRSRKSSDTKNTVKEAIPRFELLKTSDQEFPSETLEVNTNNLERSESIPSLAEPEDIDDYLLI